MCVALYMSNEVSQVEFRNVNNRDDMHIAQVRASVKNPDKSTVHSLFYKVRQLPMHSVDR